MADDYETRAAIKELFDVAGDNELRGAGHLPPLEVRIAAARALSSYMPHPDARAALTNLMHQDWAPREIRLAATEGMAKR